MLTKLRPAMSASSRWRCWQTVLQEVLSNLRPNEIPLIFGNSSFGSYLKSKTRDEVFKVLKQSKVNNAVKVLEAFYEKLVKVHCKRPPSESLHRNRAIPLAFAL